MALVVLASTAIGGAGVIGQGIAPVLSPITPSFFNDITLGRAWAVMGTTTTTGPNITTGGGAMTNERTGMGTVGAGAGMGRWR